MAERQARKTINYGSQREPGSNCVGYCREIASRTQKALAFMPKKFTLEKFKAGQRSDTWEWDGSQWREISSNGPAKRDHHAMAYNPVRGKTVLFGGFSDGNYLGDTWEWNGESWTQVTLTGPSARGGKPGMIYHSRRGKIIIFAGGTPQRVLSDLWEWNGKQWTQLGAS
ncbi:MAG: hypothetical protein AB1489_20970 [Acidobacteriota bacterium]